MKAESGKAHEDAIYFEHSGTSIAAAVVSGAIAALLSGRRELIGQPEVVKRLLLETATDLQRSEFYQGRVDQSHEGIWRAEWRTAPPIECSFGRPIIAGGVSTFETGISCTPAVQETGVDAAKTYRLMCSYSHEDERSCGRN
jgi:hypothetical protein